MKEFCTSTESPGNQNLFSYKGIIQQIPMNQAV